MYTMDTSVGRLCELRVGTSLEHEEMNGFRARLAGLITSIPTKVVFCSDLRATRFVQPNVMDQLIALMRVDNPRLERNALLVSTASFGLQMERLVMETFNPGRRVFYDRTQCEQWLGEVLDPAERARLKAFLDEGVSAR